MASAEKKPTAKRTPKGAADDKKSAPRGGLAQEVEPDAVLAAVIGQQRRNRAEITKAIWDYVKSNGLQDSEDRRKINADDKLKAVFSGRDQVTMFEMTRLVNEHVK
ncbi:MAG: SWIB/MDM2 domain-containing protein [Myxococcota bacterium]